MDGSIHRLTAAVLGEARARSILAALDFAPVLDREEETVEVVDRAAFAIALNAILFAGLLDRVPTGARYVASVAARGARVRFDHGALRTIDGPTGALPGGHGAFARLLEPLGYRVGGVYPLPRLRMTGRAYVHADFPETVPQFFVSELHVDQLSEEAQGAVKRIFGQSVDPLDDDARAMLDAFAGEGRCAFALAQAGLLSLVRAFGRQHGVPRLHDYEMLRVDSAEGAWMATEGNAFNHATDRVDDVVALADVLREEGYPIKPDVEISVNKRVRQTAFLADKVTRDFVMDDGSIAQREVPGSFYEFISRDIDPDTGRLDLSFDSGNATGIFSVTRAS